MTARPDTEPRPIGPRHGHYQPVRVPHNTYCHACERTLIRRWHLAYTDDRAPDAIVCGRCVNTDPAFTTLTAAQPPAVLPPAGELDGQTSLLLPGDADAD